MLTRALLRVHVAEERLTARWWTPSAAALALAGQLLDHWRAQRGRRRAEVSAGADDIARAARHPRAVRALAKALDDACTYDEAPDGSAARACAFDASARLLARPAASLAAHRAAVAAALGGEAEALAGSLYADLPDDARLARVPDWDERRLLAEANLAQAQGLLLYARDLAVRLDDPDLGRRRLVLRAARWRRLVAEARAEGTALHLALSGPAAVLEQGRRYGLQLAQWLPVLCACRRWQLSARLDWPGCAAPLACELDDRGHWPPRDPRSEWQPPELAAWLRLLPGQLPGWRAAEAEPLALPGGRIVLPDLRLDDGTGPVLLECFHRWHRAALAERCAQLTAGELPPYLLAVERTLLRREEAARPVAAPEVAPRVLPFTELPAPRALAEALARLRAAC